MAASVAGFPAQPGLSAPKGSREWEAAIIEAAREAGRSLLRSEADTGQVIWSWSRSDGTGPMFLTRRVALTWMADVLERSGHDL
jgi:hypothetical protein